ncbi:MAG: hypothetical protein K9G46_13485 [Flavobacteriales bacterium]|nr:hypothetical protein [Flavobacteriales bacterium]
MKRLFVVALSVILLNEIALAQGANQLKIIFYGCDISQSKITDPKRGGQDLARYMHELLAEVYAASSETKLKKWFELDDVIASVNATYPINRNVATQDIYYPAFKSEGTIKKDSIQKLIYNYDIKENSGIGYVVIFEYLSKERKSVSGYGVFFDVKTKNILLLLHNEFRDRNSYGNFKDYWVPAIGLVKGFALSFKKELQKGDNGKKDRN